MRQKAVYYRAAAVCLLLAGLFCGRPVFAAGTGDGRAVKAASAGDNAEAEKDNAEAEKNGAETNACRAVERRIREYYEAMEAGDCEAAAELRGTQDAREDRMIALIKQHGLEKYDRLAVSVYPVETAGEGAWFLAVVTYELQIEGIRAGLPGLASYPVYQDADGGISLNQEMEEAVQEEIWKLLQSDDILEKMADVTERYGEVLETEEVAAAWIEELQRAEMEAGADFYTVKEGDCLWKIAGMLYGEETRWKELYECNREIIGPNPSLILPGMRLSY